MKIFKNKAVNANRIMCRTLKAAAVFMPMLLSSCVYEDALQKAECGSTDQLTLQLNLTLPAASQGTRAGNHGSDPGSEAENYIDVKGGDYRVLVYDADNGDYITEVSMLEFSKLADTGSEVIYSLLGDIDLRNEPDKKLENFRVMILANWNAYDNDRSYGDFDFTGKESDIYADKENYNFTNPATSTAAWVPDTEGASPRLIPMFGVSKDISVSQAVEGYIFYNDLYGSIPMLRSIAKVEIVDNLNNPITGITLSKSSAKGRFIPDVNTNPNWNVPGTQVTRPSLPDYATGEAPEIDNVPLFKTAGLNKLNEERPVWVAYIPEMYVSSKERDYLNEVRPHFDITTENGTPYMFRFDNFDENGKEADVESKELQYVLRNHIYHYDVEAPSSFLNVTSKVLPWDMEWEELEFVYDAPNLEQPLVWQDVKDGEDTENTDSDPTKAVYMKSSQKLIMMDGNENYVEGRFRLTAPMKATWKASLVSLQGETDAFVFVTETLPDGTEKTYNGGIIDGNDCIIRIQNKYQQVAEKNNEMRLVIEIEYPDKTYQEVIVVPQTDDNIFAIKNYTIVQQVTEVM